MNAPSSPRGVDGSKAMRSGFVRPLRETSSEGSLNCSSGPTVERGGRQYETRRGPAGIAAAAAAAMAADVEGLTLLATAGRTLAAPRLLDASEGSVMVLLLGVRVGVEKAQAG